MPASNVRNRLAATAAAILLLGAMLALSRDFGFTWDERFQQKYGEQLWDYYQGRIPRSDFDTDIGNQYLYGGLVELIAVAAQHAVTADTYVTRHMVNAAFGWLGIVFCGVLAARMFGVRAGWIAAALITLSPRYFGDAMNNPKDVPFAALAMATIYYTLTIGRRPPHLTWGHAAKLATAIALAINVRPLGLILLAYAAAFALFVACVAAVQSSASDRWRAVVATAGRMAVIALIAVPAGTLAWPWAQASPYLRPIEGFLFTSRASWAEGFYLLFGGETLGAGSVPWTYVPTWLVLALPPVVLVGLGLSIALGWRRGADAATAWVALAAFAVAPVALAIVRHATIYDGIRHLLFVVPPLIVLAAAGWNAALDAAPPARAVAAVLLVLGLLEPLDFQIRNHPNQIVYFSPLTGGPRAAFGRYDMDYWANSVLQAVRWSAQVAERSRTALGVSGNPVQAVQADAGRYRSLWVAPRSSRDFHLDIRLLRGPRESLLEFAARPDILYRVTTADGTPLCIVLPGPAFVRDRAWIKLP
jgi:hypothetical protein